MVVAKEGEVAGTTGRWRDNRSDRVRERWWKRQKVVSERWWVGLTEGKKEMVGAMEGEREI